MLSISYTNELCLQLTLLPSSTAVTNEGEKGIGAHFSAANMFIVYSQRGRHYTNTHASHPICGFNFFALLFVRHFLFFLPILYYTTFKVSLFVVVVARVVKYYSRFAMQSMWMGSAATNAFHTSFYDIKVNAFLCFSPKKQLGFTIPMCFCFSCAMPSAICILQATHLKKTWSRVKSKSSQTNHNRNYSC